MHKVTFFTLLKVWVLYNYYNNKTWSESEENYEI